MKKFIAILLVCLMTVSLCVPVFAAKIVSVTTFGEDMKQVNDIEPTEGYTVYPIFFNKNVSFYRKDSSGNEIKVDYKEPNATLNSVGQGLDSMTGVNNDVHAWAAIPYANLLGYQCMVNNNGIVEIKFTGTAISIGLTRLPNQDEGSKMKIKVVIDDGEDLYSADNVFKPSANTDAGRQVDKRVFTCDTLSEGEHTVRIYNAGGTGTAYIDFYEVKDGHTHTPEVVKYDVITHATCCTPGLRNKVTRCTGCGVKMSDYEKETYYSDDTITVSRLTDDMSVIEVSPEITAADAVVSVKDGLKYGEAVYADGKLTYTPTKAAGGVEDVVLEITSGEHTHTHTVKIIPAPAVYYEDGVFTYGEGWEEITGDTLSGGKAHKATVFGEQFAKAEFTFKGTGFDLIASTSAASGTAFISVKSTKEGSEAKNYLIDTYYTGDKAINQAPVLKITGLEYGEYTVTVTTGYSAVFSHDRASYEFVIDAIRVYDPAGDSEEALTKYKEDGIAYPDYIKVRDILIKAGSFSTDSDINGAVFIDGNNGTASIADYKTKGPKNEVYLAKDQAIAFGFTVPAGAKYVKIGMRSVYGNDLSCSVGGKDITIGSAEYVDITDFAGETIVIRNSGDGLLSVTDIVVSYEAEKVSETGMTFTMTGSSLMAALSSESDDNGTEESVIPDGGNNPVTPEQPKNDKNPDTNTTDTDAPETEKPEDNTPDTDIPDGEDDNDKIPDDKPARPAENAPVAPGGRLADMIGRFIISVIKNIIAALLG